MGAGYDIARAVQRVIEDGHPPELAWGYTPRQLSGWIALAERRRAGQLGELLGLMQLANSEDGDAIRKQIARLMEQAQ
jgi:hypothetical protein